MFDRSRCSKVGSGRGHGQTGCLSSKKILGVWAPSLQLSGSLHRFSTTKNDKIGFQPYFFFSPQVVLEINGNSVSVHAQNPPAIFEQICKVVISEGAPVLSIATTPVLAKDEYIKKIHSLQSHIHRGDCYEINFCQEIFAEDVAFDPTKAYQKLAAISPNPFSAFYRINITTCFAQALKGSWQKKTRRFFRNLLKEPLKETWLIPWRTIN
jgi:para-aminobenzoate synthetase component 1